MVGAIDALTRANHVHHDAGVESRLVDLRRDARSLPPSSSVLPTWPPDVPDLFFEVVGPPEISAAALTPEVLRSGIFHHGCLLVRGLVGPDRVDQLVADIDRAFAAHDANVEGAPNSEGTTGYSTFDPGPGSVIYRDWIRSTGAVLAADSPHALFDVIETFEEIGMRDLLTEFFGERPLLLAKKVALRRVQPRVEPSFWHQDGAFMGADTRSVNVWLALSACGVDAPGLDIVNKRLDEIVDTGTDGADFDWSVGAATVDRVAPHDVVVPVFAPGDALLFDHMLLHRTSVNPAMTRDRYALEAWFAAPSSYPADQIAIAF